MIKSVLFDKGSLDLLLLGYDSPPTIGCSRDLPVSHNNCGFEPLPSKSCYDAIILSPSLNPSQVASARSQAPDATIIAHLSDTADQQAMLCRIQQGADDVIFDNHMAVDRLLTTQILIARERRQAASAIKQRMATDTLTGLSDRNQFLQRLQQLLDQHRQSLVAVMILDIQSFTGINDSLGHAVGDELLQAVGARLNSLAEDGAFCARIGHDHFAIAIDSTVDIVNASIYAETIVALARKPYRLSSTSQDIYITVSLGLTLEDGDGIDADSMLRQANIALSRAKQAGCSIARFEPTQEADVHYKHLLRNNLHSALANNELFMVYQSQIDMLTGRVEGVEALMRWQHPALGLISPDLFIPLLEETGLINEVGFWAIESVCKQLRQWRDVGKVDADFSVAINISSKQFHDSDLAGFIEQVIQRNGISPAQIKLELTESLLVVDAEKVAGKLQRLKALGVLICIDDFGTGYASLSYLRQFPIDVLKIDRSFVQNIGVSEQNDAIVLAIINLAHELHFRVVAEGVETQAQRAFLTQHRCDTFQGYLFSKPIPAAQVRVHNDAPGHSAYIGVA
jgi:diguanylate cyclase (GGDEF)-like protein